VTIRLLHTLALFWMMGGIGAVMVPIWKAWATGDLEIRALLLSEAQRNEVQWLIPGMLATLFTGVAWVSGNEGEYNFIRTGWLLALEVVFALDGFIFLPLMGVGLRRVRFLALQAKHRGEMTDELREALADNVPVVFGTVITISVPIMVWLAVFKPF
jgi:uncharacterized membrane protein